MTAWLNYLDTLIWKPGYLDASSYSAFLRAASFKIPAAEAQAAVAEQIRRAGSPVKPSKISNQLERAYRYVGQTVLGDSRTPISKPPVFSPSLTTSLAQKRGYVVDECMVIDRSPIDIQSVTIDNFLDCLYQPGEKVLVFTVFTSQGQYVYEVGKMENPTSLYGGSEGVWFLSNPVDGLYHPNPRQDRQPSRRSEESVTSWRYLVLESDVAEPHVWLSILLSIPLKIAAIYTSGGKSIHALVRVDATSKADWDYQCAIIKKVLVPLGADPQALTAVRLTRLPGCWRGSSLQRLLYLNPDPQAEAILN